MKIGFVMDPLDAVQIDADTTFALMLAAQARGHEVHYLRMQDLAWEHDRPHAWTQRATVRRVEGDHFELEAREYLALDALDVVFMRKDPPFDVAYLHAMQLLERAQELGVFVLNNPRGLMAANEKLYALNFPDALPRTLVTQDVGRIRSFVEELGGVAMVKPVDGHGGSGIFMVRSDDRNMNAILEVSTREGREAVICQEYVPAARLGDKRILMLGGEPLGGLLRVPQADDHRGNIHVGGSVQKAELTPRDLEICAMVGPRLVADGLHFVGIDVLGDYLTEVNVTSPTGIQEMGRFDEVDYADQVIAWIEGAM